MTGQNALNLVMFRLGNRTDATLRAACLLEMQLLQQVLEGSPTKPWFLFDRYSSPDGGVTFFHLTTGVGYVTLPSDFLALDEDECAVYLYDPDTGDGTALSNVVARLSRASVLNTELFLDNPGDEALPRTFNLEMGQLHVRPVPDKNYIVRLPGYFADDAPGDTSVENLWLKWAADLLIAGTVYEVATKHTRDLEIAAVAQADFERARRRLAVENEERRHTAMRYAIGGSDR